jgi:hypothetical protein
MQYDIVYYALPTGEQSIFRSVRATSGADQRKRFIFFTIYAAGARPAITPTGEAD